MIEKHVQHKSYGKGVISQIFHKGLEFLVKFPNGLERLVRSDDVTIISPNPPLTTISKESPFDQKQFYSRSMIEAFRMGVVPYGKVDQFTFGRKDEVEKTKEWLSIDGAGPMIIEGTYGTGKSHFIEYIVALALNNGYAVVRTDLDPHTCPPHRPKQVFSQLMKSFRFKKAEKTFNLREFLRTASNTWDPRQSKLKYLGQVLTGLKHNPENPIIWEWIEGQSSSAVWLDGSIPCYLPSLKNWGTTGNIYCHMLSELAWIATSQHNLKGLLVVLDEGETASYPGAVATQFNQGWNFIQGLMHLSADDIRLEKESVARTFQSAGGSYFGDETDLIYSGVDSDVRYCVQLPAHLKVVFSFTEVSINEWLESNEIMSTAIQMKELSKENLQLVFSQILELYKHSYQLEQITQPDLCFEKIQEQCNDGIRKFIKGSVELLDIRRSNPKIPVEQIE